MKIQTLLAGAAIAAAASFAALSAQAADIVVDGGFEAGAGDAPWVFSGWGVGPVEVPVHSGNHDAYTGCVGAGCVDVNSGASVYQDLATNAGGAYDLNFWFAGAGQTDELKVLWDGNQVLDLVNSQIVSNNGLGPETLYTVSGLVAATTTTRLEFFGRQDPGFNGLDDVSVTDAVGTPGVPEPASWALMLGGFGLAGAALRRRRTAIAA